MVGRFPCLTAITLLILVPLSTHGVAQPRATPSDAIDGILEAFKTRQIVGIPDPHRNTATHAFLLALIRAPRFPTLVNDVVVEFGNALHQDVADRFVRGEYVPYATLRRIWLDTTQAQPASDTPQAEETLRTVRAVNASLRRELQIRVLQDRPDVAAWPVPSLIVLRGTDMGAAPVSYDGPRVSVQTGQIVPVPRDQWRSIRLQDQYDALLYIGARASWSYAMVSPALCANPTYVEMRTGRMALAEWKSDRLEDYCGKVLPPAQ